MLTSALVLLLSSAHPVRIAATTLSVAGDDEKKASVWLDRFAEVMGRDRRVELTTPSALAQLMGMERQRQLMGCSAEGNACMAELAAALGADGILSGSITRSGESYLAVVRIIRQQDAKVWWSASERLKGEDALLDWLDAQAKAAVDAVLGVQPTTLPVGAFIVGGAGVVALGVGAAYFVTSNTTTLTRLRAATNPDELATAEAAGKGETTMALITTGGGAALVAASVVWLLAAPKGGAAPAAALVPLVGGGALVSVGGAF